MSQRLVALYYWLTPAFWWLDVALGANLRTAALDSDTCWKSAYYLFCLACGGVVWWRPGWTRLVGLTEASVNILLLLLGVLLPYYRIVDQLAAGGTFADSVPFGAENVVTLILAGGIWVLSFRMHASGLGRARQ